MRKTIFYYSGVLWMVCALAGCKENVALEYENDPRLYFYNSTLGQRDSIAHTFFVLKEDQIRDTVWLDIRTMGYPEKADRPIGLVQSNIGNPDAAVSGKHFIAFDNAEIKPHMVIPAGEVMAKIPIIMLHDPSLDTSIVRMELAIVENQCFKPGIDVWTQFVVTTTAAAVKPTNWDSRWKSYFGVWGSVKMKFIIEYVGFSDFENPPTDASFLTYLQNKAKQKLLEYNLTHPDLEEADGTPVTF